MPRSVDPEVLAAKIRECADQARSEEDLKMGVEPLLRDAFERIGLDSEIAEYEKATTALRSRRADVVYGFLVLEYKAPGRLESDATLTRAVEQLRDSLEGESRKHDDPASFLERAVGVALDGRAMAFVRYSRRGEQVQPPPGLAPRQIALTSLAPPKPGFRLEGPFDVGAASVGAFLMYARAQARRPLTAEALGAAFGPDQPAPREAVTQLYSAISRGRRQDKLRRAMELYSEWDRLFGVVYGEDLDRATEAAQEAAAAYGMTSGVRLKPLLFSIHTFYALLMKLIAVEVLSMVEGFRGESFVHGLSGLDDEGLRGRLAALEKGAEYHARGIENFLEADFFSWYLDAWVPKLVSAIRSVATTLAEFEPATPVLRPDWTRDLLQRLYEAIVPRKLRHGLGEYYTPDWLAEHVVVRSGYAGTVGERFLDPACGSGTFLVQAIRRAIARAAEERLDPTEAGAAILSNVVGFDLNPLAVLASRTNYLIALAPLLAHVRPVSLPVYLCDSVVPPRERRENQADLFRIEQVVFEAGGHEFTLPASIKKKESLDAFTRLALQGLDVRLDPAQFARRLGGSDCSWSAEERKLLEAAYSQLKELHDSERDGIWAHYIKNAFAPAYAGRFDFVVGNPPWIRWRYLSGPYRERTLPLWKGYRLFSLKGHEARLGAGEKDFSMLFTYACADRYLKDGGTLAFVITYEVFKSKGAGEGFRRFRIGEGSGAVPLRPLWVEDMVHLQPFEAANKTCVAAWRKGEEPRYPIPALRWTRKPGTGRIPAQEPLDRVMARTLRETLVAAPVDPERAVSAWQTATRDSARRLEKVKGRNPYTARRGASTEPYGVFWLRIREVRPDRLLVVENQHERGKRQVLRQEAPIEPDLVFPALAGGDLRRFGHATPFPLLVVQDPSTRRPYSQDWLLDNAPLTHAWVARFKSVLESRGSRVVKDFADSTEYWAMYGIGDYTFAPYRVAWKRMTQRMAAVVLSRADAGWGRKPLIGTDTTSLIALDNRDEAHYLCAVLNSSLVNSFIASFAAGGRGFGAPSVVAGLGIPSFDQGFPVHARLARLSQEAHRAVAAGRDISDLDAEIDAEVRRLWNIES